MVKVENTKGEAFERGRAVREGELGAGRREVVVG
jgi:hypothetical protein